MKPDLTRRDPTLTARSAPVQTYFVVIGFGKIDGQAAMLDVTYVADQDLAVEMALEDRAFADGVAVYELRSHPAKFPACRPRLVFSCGSLPANGATLVAEALTNL